MLVPVNSGAGPTRGEPPPAAATPDRAYIPALDGLRAVSISLVILSHLGLGGSIPGGLGVTVFFFISGLLITRQLLAEIARTGRIALGHFALRRVLRLYPALLVMIVLGGLLFVALGGTIRLDQLLAALFYWSNYMLIANGFATPRQFHPYAILWSLAVEEHFYLLFPLAVLSMRRRPSGLVLALVAALAAVLAWRCAIVLQCAAGMYCQAGLQDRITYATDTRIDAILYGAVVSALLAGRWQARALRLLSRRATPLAGLLLLLLSLAVRDAGFRDTWRYSVQGIALAALAGWLIFAPAAGRWRQILAAPPLILVGRLSYSLYLWHWALLAAADTLLPARIARLTEGNFRQHPFDLAVAAFLLLASLAAAAASFYGIERPVLRLRHRLGSRA